MMKRRNEVIIIGDSTHNTLSAVRSFGEAKVPRTLILVGDDTFCHVAKSKYLRNGHVYQISKIWQAMGVLERLPHDGQLLVCTFDEAAMWVDENEPKLSKWFVTPCRGKRIDGLFNKDAQCELARKCGLTVPQSKKLSRQELSQIKRFPTIIKPLVSTRGDKSDIHIIRTAEELAEAIKAESHCDRFIAQEYIDKEYELDCIGVSTDTDVIISGAVQKIRHYPWGYGAGAYGLFKPLCDIDIDTEAISRFVRMSNYHGPFSVEFLHTVDGKNYFMEVNFRNEGLAYASTAAGANLHAVYAEAMEYNERKVKPTYMMNYSIDYLYAKDGTVSKLRWWRDFLRTRAFININFRDLGPIYEYYKRKLLKHRVVITPPPW